MKLSNEMNNLLNEQLHSEFYSSYLYLSMAAFLEGLNYSGMAKWMELQAEEEREHGMKLYHFINTRGGVVELRPIEAPPQSWESPKHVFEASLEHECSITKNIYKLYEASLELKDYASNSFLQWYLNEQVEEEATVKDILQKMEWIGNEAKSLYFIDRELGKRGRA